MKVSYQWLQEYIGGRMPKPEKVAELLTMHAFEVDGIEKKGRDAIIDVSVLPNRAHDCLSHRGIAREVAAILKLKVKSKKVKVWESKKEKIGNILKVKVQDQKFCPRYTARVITGVRVAPSPAWLRGHLEALGQRSVNNIVDATNYVMLALGQPLHAFDLEKIAGRTIIVRPAREGEEMETLDGVRVRLASSDTIIADAEGALAIAGVKGGKKAEIAEGTTTIVLEAATFEQSAVRKTAKHLNLRTEASIRFESGLSPVLPGIAIDEVAALVVAIAGGEVIRGVVDIYPKKAVAGTVLLQPGSIEKILGVAIPEKDVLACLKRLGFSMKKTKKGYLVAAPAERMDIRYPADIAEEIVRLVGLAHVPSVLPESTLIPAQQDSSIIVADDVRDIFASIGFSETYSRSFISVRHLGYFHDAYEGVVSVANPLSEDQKYLRPSLLFALLDAVRENMKHQKSVRLFEIGNVFSSNGKGKPNERRMIAGVCAEKTGGRDDKGFYEAKGAVDSLCEKMGIADVWYDDLKEDSGYGDARFWHRGRSAEIKIADTVIGVVGEIDPALLHRFDVSERVAAIEIDHGAFAGCVEKEKEYRPIPKFPAVERDIAVVAPREVKIDTIQGVLESAGGALLIDSDLFDIYEGEHINASQKSLAFHLVFQSSERTLTDAEVDAAFSDIVSALRKEGWEVRS